VYALIQPQPPTSVKLPLHNYIQEVKKYWTFHSDSIKVQLYHSFIIFL